MSAPPPSNARARDDGRAERAAVDERLQLADRRLQTILKDDAKRHAGGGSGGDEPIGALGGDLERFLDQHVESAACGGRAVLAVQPRGRPDRDHVHLGACEKRLERVRRRGADSRCERPCAFERPTVNGDHGGPPKAVDSPHMRCADVARPDDSDAHRRRAGYPFPVFTDKPL